MQKKVKILISNLHPDALEEELQELIEEYGEVSDLTFSEDPDPVLETFTAVVTMVYEDEAEEVLENIHGKRWMGLRLEADYYVEKKKSSRELEEEDSEDWSGYAKGQPKSQPKRPRGFRNS